ncbi:dihydrofolate reductase family protein [Microbacterium sp. STN6]|uniref:dihydrofolate reductase family protein n=1 Tax=Microbacterium sp. STN6 TaxID=2995588 RepID=UPI002260E15E|nr:dihydrofolate reductase family protein [Microbacterium sp. STN6]MCX7522597.1 dihydrofolate reductase family protein [Microbacterium sp. STN6]
MANLIYSAITSLDGYINDESGRFDWATPTGELHAFINDGERAAGTYLYGRRMYEVMRFWETVDVESGPGEVDDGLAAAMRDYANIWRDADKVVYSTSLEAVSSARTRLERRFEPEAIRALKNEVGTGTGTGTDEAGTGGASEGGTGTGGASEGGAGGAGTGGAGTGEASTGDIGIGGAVLAAQALAAGLVDEVRQFIAPVIIGGGTPFLPAGLRLDLTLVDERRFAGGFVYLQYRTA